MAGPVPKMSKDAILASLVDDYLKTPVKDQPKALDSLATRGEAAYKRFGFAVTTTTRDEIKQEILGRSVGPVGPVVPKVADAANEVYSDFAKKYTTEFARLKTLSITDFERDLKPLVDDAEKEFKKAQKKDATLKIPTRKEIEQEIIVRGEMKEWLANNVLPACKKFEKLLSNESMTVERYRAGVRALNEGQSIDQLWVALRKVGVDEKVITRLQAGITADEALQITTALSRDLYHFEAAPDRTVRGALTAAGAAIWAYQLPAAKITSLFFTASAVGPVKAYDAIRGTDVWANRTKPWLDDFANKRGLLATPKAVFAIPILAGAGYFTYKLYRHYVPSKEEEIQGGAPALKPVIRRDDAKGIPDELAYMAGGGIRKPLMESTEGAARELKIVKKIQEALKGDENAQKRCFDILLDMINGNKDFKSSSQKFIAKLEDVGQFVAALVELQKSKADTAVLATAMFSIIKYYKLEVYGEVAKDLVAYLNRNPRADVEKALMEPETMLKSIGQALDKYAKQMTQEWMKRPFPIFKDMGFDETQPYVKDASAMIRAYFRKEDWEEVARAMATAYKEQRFEQNPRDRAPTTVPERYIMHLEALSILMYATSEPGLQNEMPGRGIDLRSAIDTLALFTRYIKQERQWAGDEAGQRQKAKMWLMAASEVMLYKPTLEGLDEGVKSVLSMHPEWLRPDISKSVIDTSPISSMLAEKIKTPEKRLALAHAINDIFTGEYRQRAAQEILAMVDDTMTVSEIQEVANGLAFEARTGYRGALWKTFMDKDLESFFPSEGEEARNAAKFKADTARSLHTLTTHEEYVAARDALVMFIQKFSNDAAAGYADLKEGKHIDPTPEIIAIAAFEIAKAVRGQENPDINKVSSDMLASKEKKYTDALSKLPIKQEKKRK